MAASQIALVDVFFAGELSGIAVSLDEQISERCPSWFAGLARRSGLARGLSLFWFGRSHPVVAIVCDARGSWTFLFLEAWLRRRDRRVVLLEFIRRRPTGWRRVLYPLWFRIIARPAVKRTLYSGQVLTSWERERNAKLFSLPVERLEFIPWALSHKGDKLPEFDPHLKDGMVFSSGRPACDWDTLFKAAAGREWPLTVACGKKDHSRLERLNRDGRARLLCDIPFEEHHALLESASIYVISVKETEGSTGQVRLSNAIRAGVPVVATAIKGFDGYIVEGETALTVPPGDWQAMRDTIESLLDDPEKREKLRTAAFENARGWTFEEYIDRMRDLLKAALAAQNPAIEGK